MRGESGWPGIVLCFCLPVRQIDTHPMHFGAREMLWMDAACIQRVQQRDRIEEPVQDAYLVLCPDIPLLLMQHQEHFLRLI